MPERNKATIEKFYAAFDAHDGDTMASCYTDDATFRDPVFGDLDAKGVRDMWKMLTGRAEDLGVKLAEHESEDSSKGSAHWIATYTFAQTGRPVVNQVYASFLFEDGLISQHHDFFSFHTWARQALGTPGLLLGWLPPFQKSVSKKALEGLAAYQAENK